MYWPWGVLMAVGMPTLGLLAVFMVDYWRLVRPRLRYVRLPAQKKQSLRQQRLQIFNTLES